MNKVQALAGAAQLKAMPREGDTGPLEGVAIVYGQAGRPYGYYPECEALVFEPGCFTASLAKRMSAKTRDIKFIGFHEDPQIVASTAGGTLMFYDSETELRYRAELDLRDPDAMRIYIKVSRGDVTMASVGCYMSEFSDPEMMLDNSEEAKVGLYDCSTDKEIVVQRVITADLVDVSAVGHGAFGSSVQVAAGAQGSNEMSGSGLRIAPGTAFVVCKDGLLRPVQGQRPMPDAEWEAETPAEAMPAEEEEGAESSAEAMPNDDDPNEVVSLGDKHESMPDDDEMNGAMGDDDDEMGAGANDQPTGPADAATVTRQDAINKLDELLAQ